MPVRMAKNQERAAADAERLATLRRDARGKPASLAADPAAACATASEPGASRGRAADRDRLAPVSGFPGVQSPQFTARPCRGPVR